MRSTSPPWQRRLHRCGIRPRQRRRRTDSAIVVVGTPSSTEGLSQRRIDRHRIVVREPAERAGRPGKRRPWTGRRHPLTQEDAAADAAIAGQAAAPHRTRLPAIRKFADLAGGRRDGPRSSRRCSTTRTTPWVWPTRRRDGSEVARVARRVAARLFLDIARRGLPTRRGVHKITEQTYRPDAGDLDLDASFDAIAEAVAGGVAIDVERSFDRGAPDARRASSWTAAGRWAAATGDGGDRRGRVAAAPAPA